MAAEYVRFIGHYAHMIQYTGENVDEITEFLGTRLWMTDEERRPVVPGDWLYLDKEGKPAIVSQRRKRLYTETVKAGDEPQGLSFLKED